MTSTQLKFELFEDEFGVSSPEVAAAVEALAKQEGAETRGAIFTRPEVVMNVGKNGGAEPFLNTKLDSSHSFGMTNNTVVIKADSSHMFGMTNNAVISTEGRNLYRPEGLGHPDYRNFEGVIEKAKMACFNSGHRLEDHFVDVTEMVEIGNVGQQELAYEHIEESRRLLLREEMRRHSAHSLSFRPKGEISCQECIATTCTY